MILIVLFGMLTWYDCADFSPVTRCGYPCDDTHAWVAADVDNGPYRCGEWLAICAAGECRVLPVRDSGLLSQFCVMDGDVCRDILIDVPQHVAAGWWNGLSTRAVVVSASKARERMERER
jgi:hypothetical protein